jgi:hypothetical protein
LSDTSVFSVRYAPARVLAHFGAAAAFLAAAWAVVFAYTTVDLAAAAILSALILGIDGYGTVCRLLRREPIVTLSQAALVVHLPEIGALPWTELREPRVTGNWIFGRAIEFEYRGARPETGITARLGWGVSARERDGRVRLSIGCLEQGDRARGEIETALAACAAGAAA